MTADSAVAIAGAVRSGRVSAEETVSAVVQRIDQLDGAINAMTQVFGDRAVERGRAIDAKVAAGEDPGLLAGVPIAIKDNICVAWGRTTCASRMLEHYESPYCATAVQRLIDAGAVVVGKTNLDEFAMGSSCERSIFGPTHNPWDLSRVPGGSSGGSAAAVAAGMVPVALGSDTGGSVRQPAGLCGVVGLKPTYGCVSRYGLTAFASSLDQIGPIGRTVADVALVLAVIAGHDPRDATSRRGQREDYFALLDEPIEDLVVGVPTMARAGCHRAVERALDEAVAALEGLGARVREIKLPHADAAVAAYYIIAPAEASSNLARYDGVRYGHRAMLAPDAGLEALYCASRSEGFGPEVQRRIMLGTHVLSSGYYDQYYQSAVRARRLIRGDYDEAFEAGCHALLMPTSPGPAFGIGQKIDDPLALYLEDVFTVGANLAGLPAISVPGGFAGTGDGRLPIGLQLIAPAWEDARLLRIARMFERATDHAVQRPVLSAQS